MDAQNSRADSANRSGITAKGFSRRAKLVLAVLFSVLWLGLLVVALETYSRLREMRSERQNPYIMGRKPIGPLSPTGTPIVLDNFHWAIQPLPPRHSDALSPAVDCADTAWPQCFYSLNAMQRHLAAGHHDAIVLELDKAGRLVETWGFPLEKDFLTRAGRGISGYFLKWAVTASGFDSAVSAALSGTVTAKPLSLPLVGLLCDAEFRPIPATGGIFVFLPNALAGANEESPPPDSPWEVPYFRYKKGIPNPHWGTPGTCYLNNAGFRGKNVTIPKPAGRFRIVCVGGSTTEEGPTDDTTYPALLEKKLNAAFPEYSIEVVNCGISGMHTASHLMRFADYLALEPDLIVLYEGVNDAASILPIHWLLCDSPLWAKAACCSHFLRLRYNSLLYKNEDKLESDVRASILDRFALMRQWALANKAEIVFCSVASPPYADLPREDREYLAYRTRGFALASPPTYQKIIGAVNAGLQERSTKDGWGYIPVAENFHFGLGCFGDMCHMYPEWIDRKAEIVFQCLKQRMPELLRRRR